MTSILSRWGGLASIGGGILWLAFFGLQAVAPAATTSEPYMVLNHTLQAIYVFMFLLSGLLFAAGLLGLYTRQGERAGAIGNMGAVVAVLGGALFVAGGLLTSFFEIDWAWSMMMFGLALLMASLLLLGISALGTRELGRWSFVPLIVGVLSLAAFVSAFLGVPDLEPVGPWLGPALATLVGVGWVLIGYALVAERRRPETVS
jgi:peptidoglycan/LPS O-acetylase OafA/YrhL